MHRITRPVLVTAAVGAILFGAGCGGGATTGTAAPQSATTAAAAPTSTGGDAVGWIDNVCGSLQQFTNAAVQVPQIDSSSPQATIKGYSDYLGKVITGVDSAISGMQAAGPSPVASGDEAVKKLTDALNNYKSKFQQAKTGLDSADPSDPAALKNAVAPLQDLQNAPNPVEGLDSSPELEKAAEQAPNCQALSKLGNQTGGATGGTGGN